MYCPSCGKDNPETARFCRGCGRSLAGILQPASPESESAFERIEHRLDEIIAGYASRYFKGRAGSFVPPTTLKESWKLLGQGFLTVLGDLIFTYLVIQFVLQFRLWVLLIKSPALWWRERKARKAAPLAAPAPVPLLPEPLAHQIPGASVTEETTQRLSEHTPPPRERA